MAINYPATPSTVDARTAVKRIWNFVSNLPCDECKFHAIRFVMQSPPALESTYSMQTWAWKFHNSVNARLGKPVISYTKYQHLYSDEICWASWGVNCQRRK